MATKHAGSANVYEINNGLFHKMELLPELVTESNKHSVTIDYDASDEVQFDAEKHLDLEIPKSVRIFDEDGLTEIATGTYKKEISKEISKFACSSTFRIFSDEGAAQIYKIAKELQNYEVVGVRNTRVRGTWHCSPFFRDFMSSPQLINHMSNIIGEPVIPMLYLSTTGQINYGKANAGKKVDEWHFDSVAFVAVIMLSDMEDMIGGELQFIKHPKKVSQQLLLTQTLQDKDVETVSYKKQGYCIAAQGSELCHQVTEVKSAREDRISFVVSFMPANVYQPDRFVYQTMKSAEDEDNKPGLAEYDMFRYRAWRGKNVLANYVNKQPFTHDKELLAMKLIAVANDLMNAANEISTGGLSKIGFYTEDGKRGDNPG